MFKLTNNTLKNYSSLILAKDIQSNKIENTLY